MKVRTLALKLIATLSVAALAGCAVLTDRQASSRTQAAETEFPPEGQFINVDGRQVHAVVAGRGPDVILIHGAGGNTREFTFSFMDRLTDRYRVTVFDRPGMGYTDRASADYEGAFTAAAESPAEQAAMLHAASRQLGIERAIVVGHSYGGAVALAWALNHPEQTAGVVNLAGVSHPWPGDLGAYYTVNGSAVGGAVVPPLIAAFASDARIEDAVAGIFAPQPVPEGYIDHIGATLTIRPDSFRANTRQVNTLRPHIVEMSRRYAEELTMPIEILHGDKDTTVPLDIHSIPLERVAPNATLTVLEGVGHMPHHAAPDLVEQAIDRIAVAADLG
ncbi:alpha/beta fold hydrolase [Pseudooctadecabacter jejudonensis]|uniref:Lipase 1 n=1 Tax=Pseudooctadecabacter jejudonensis TaxID=1391910 RepID=A0A1Y5REM5_9RHOB|nr:alpha/beta hydrolase [Pseudooctadecabacter jejudonensis]SLN15332.1 Lipase 1 precursor [Pseudooctadecabacter jejudonensis]